ncbi:MAG: glycoside hydrolase family 88 protein [Tunicatimonas sp.]|uniref:glycoside hydrolase family 88 protein n=1 Tax=Tunicatimonas sp. TaxID=1940096 RepID=UPI003C70F3C0
MNRRSFIHQLPTLTIASTLLPKLSLASSSKKKYTRYVAQNIDYLTLSFPSDKRVPIALTAFPVPEANATQLTRLRFPPVNVEDDTLYFRITAAIDFREEKTIRMYLPDSGQEIGLLNIKYAHPFQPFQITADPQWLPEINRQGIALQMTEGTQTPWFFLPDQLPSDAIGLAPQLITGNKSASEKEFLRTLYSMNSFSPFGWMGGSVQDALYELHRQGQSRATQTLEMHLHHYLDEQQGIILESPRTQPLDGTFNSIEDFLPFAAIVNLYPDHPSVQKAVNYCRDHRNEQGIILAGKHITTEGCYTVAYPLATIAQVRKDAELAQIALDQLRHRSRYLVDELAVYQRSALSGEKAYRNWGRGVAWYLLGTIKTLAAVRSGSFNLSGTDEVQQSFVAAALMANRWKNSEYLWYSYLDQPATEVDTSASAGIAAAIMWGVQLGVLPTHYRRSAQATYRSLQDDLTPDGFLTHVSQINRGGETLQKEGYRVISQFGMGLMGQLKAALNA